MHAPIEKVSHAELFTDARTHHAWQQKDVSDELLNQVFDLAKWAPTSLNSLPARFLFVKSKAAKAKLIPALSESNVPQVVAAPVTVVVAYDEKFYDELPTLFPAFDARPLFVANPALSQATAFRNGSLQGAYLMLAARALGLDVGPMSGFDNAKVDEAFFQGKSWKSNFLCNIGYGDAENYSLAARASALNKLARSFEGFFLPAPVPQRQSTECPVTNDYVAPFGRLLIAGVFLLSGLGKLAAPAMTQAYIASTGLPLPIAGFLVAIVMEIWGGPASAGRLPYDLRGDRNGRIHE